MSYGRDDQNGGIEREDFTNSGPKKAADFVHPGRPSFDRNCTIPVENLEIDKKLLIDPKKLYIGPKIGEGAHGKVYEGKFGEQAVALKIINGGSTNEEKMTIQARFIREVNMMSRVKHKNLVKFIGACKDPIMVIATELLPGMSLKKYLESIRPKQLDLRLATSFAVDIARAMECLHANGIIHRDLKPDNLLLTANQKNVKLVDFGLAREETVTEMMTAETGTYRWMAPELYSTVTLRRGEKKHYTNKVDVYSFGIVLWELLTSRLPFEGMSNLQAAYAAAFKQDRPSIPEDTPADLDFIIRSCWVEEPNMRPCFSQIIRLLDAFLLTLTPPSPQPDASPAVISGSSGTLTTNSTRSARKLSFLRQLFAAKRAGNSRTTGKLHKNLMHHCCMEAVNGGWFRSFDSASSLCNFSV